MDVEVLNHFLTVVREENISRAAELLHVTQPTLSRQMAALEEELGTQLFIRGKHLQLTDAGVLLHGRAEEVTQIIDKIRMEFKAGGRIVRRRFDRNRRAHVCADSFEAHQ